MTNGNANYFPWEETKEDNVFPTMTGHFRVTSLEDGQSQNTGKRMIRASFQCIAPLELAGMSHFENYVVGNDEAPMAIIPGSMGTRNFKKLCKAGQVPPNNDIAVLLASAQGAELLLGMVEYEETQEGQWKGMKRNRISGYYKLGEREIGIAPAPGVKGAGVSVAPGAVAPPVPPAPSVPLQAPPVQSPPAAPAPQTAPPAPPVAPSTTPAPGTPGGAPVAPAAPTQVLRCTMCQTDVPVDQFGAHVQRHAAEPGWDGKSA